MRYLVLTFMGVMLMSNVSMAREYYTEYKKPDVEKHMSGVAKENMMLDKMGSDMQVVDDDYETLFEVDDSVEMDKPTVSEGDTVEETMETPKEVVVDEEVKEKKCGFFSWFTGCK